MFRNKLFSSAWITIALVLFCANPGGAQVGQSRLVNPELANEKELLALPHLNGAIVKTIIDQRPFLQMGDLNALLAKSLSKEQLAELYGKLSLIHI